MQCITHTLQEKPLCVRHFCLDFSRLQSHMGHGARFNDSVHRYDRAQQRQEFQKQREKADQERRDEEMRNLRALQARSKSRKHHGA